MSTLTIGLWMSFYATRFLFRVSPMDWDHERRRIEKKASAIEKFAQETLGTSSRPSSGWWPASSSLGPKDPAFDAAFPPQPSSLSAGFLVLAFCVALLIAVPPSCGGIGG